MQPAQKTSIAGCTNMADFKNLLEKNEVKGGFLQKLTAIVFGTGVALEIAGKNYVVDRKDFAPLGITNASQMRAFVRSAVNTFQKEAAANIKIKDYSPREYAIHILKTNPDKVQGSLENINALFDALKGGEFDDNVLHDMQQTAGARIKAGIITLDSKFLSALRNIVENQAAPTKGNQPTDIRPLPAVTGAGAKRFLDRIAQIGDALRNPKVTPKRQECVAHLKHILNMKWNEKLTLPDDKRNEIYNAAFAVRNELSKPNQELFDRIVQNVDIDLSGFPAKGKKA